MSCTPSTLSYTPSSFSYDGYTYTFSGLDFNGMVSYTSSHPTYPTILYEPNYASWTDESYTALNPQPTASPTMNAITPNKVCYKDIYDNIYTYTFYQVQSGYGNVYLIYEGPGWNYIYYKQGTGWVYDFNDQALPNEVTCGSCYPDKICVDTVELTYNDYAWGAWFYYDLLNESKIVALIYDATTFNSEFSTSFSNGDYIETYPASTPTKLNNVWPFACSETTTQGGTTTTTTPSPTTTTTTPSPTTTTTTPPPNTTTTIEYTTTTPPPPQYRIIITENLYDYADELTTTVIYDAYSYCGSLFNYNREYNGGYFHSFTASGTYLNVYDTYRVSIYIEPNTITEPTTLNYTITAHYNQPPPPPQYKFVLTQNLYDYNNNLTTTELINTWVNITDAYSNSSYNYLISLLESINVSGSYIGLSENEEHTSKIVSVSIPANTYSSNTIVNYSVTVHMNGNTTTTTTTTTISTSTTPPPQNRYNIFAGEVPIKRIEIITTDFNQVYENRLIRRVFIGDQEVWTNNQQ